MSWSNPTKRSNIAKKISIFMILAAIAIGCKSKKKFIAEEEYEDVATAMVIEKTIASNAPANYTSIRGKGRFKGMGTSQGFKIDIRQTQGETVWIDISANMLGIKVARLLATPDSLLLYNRLDKTYLRSSVEELQKFTGLADFHYFQALLSGQLITTPPKKTMMKMQEGTWQMEFSLENTRVRAVFDASSYFLIRQEIQLPEGERLIAQYQKNERGDLEQISLFGSYEGQPAELNISVDAVDNTKPTFPFEIPRGYKAL